jgi:hypothetical protein
MRLNYSSNTESPKKKIPGDDRFSAEFYQILIPTILKLFYEIKMEEMQPNSLYKASITFILKLNKYTIKKGFACQSFK